MRARFTSRIRLLSGAILLVALILIGRLYHVQIIHGKEYSEEANGQYVNPGTNLYDRGTIFLSDKDGRLVSGATLKSGYMVTVNPSILEDPNDAYQKLSTVLSLDRDDFIKRVSRKSDVYEEVAKKITKEQADAVRKLGVYGVTVLKERWRYYPGDELAAHTLGFVGFLGEQYAGRYGLERYYDDTLSRDDSKLYVNFFAEIFSNISRTLFTQKSSAGDLITTIEPSVQLFLERKLQTLQEKWGSKLSAGIIIDPHTGEIIALAVAPTFNANTFYEEESTEIFTNPLVERVYEMGSIIKPLTMAAGIDSGAITAETQYHDTGSLTLDGSTISNFDGKARGTVEMQEVLSQSLNIGAAFIAGEMGSETLREYFYSFGMNTETGIDLPGEVHGLTGNLESPRDIEYATASFGQGIAISPIETVRALSTLANGGRLITPHIVREIQYRSGISKRVTYKDDEYVLAPETTEAVTRMLVKVVDEELAHGEAKFDHYSMAAKTGTAQIAKTGARGYYDDRYLHSFFGYFPAYDARFLIFYMTIEPNDVRYASQTLTDPFVETVKYLINYYDIPPDR
ncbi:hypothetical protein COU17_02280 [Candidatus Kaiserbacteria bacterium CG10_big_fil_rev_8_21_14_0_10_49_17]|uniref:Penicillin-binding protein transpeptidase domain-containing protein n=1 Tax=Candidatus Kaiserbacteria bacterium CG10_big_fil_rev_8_21_14_0_10_49_17 TaxID=1974609 RepID=A0A2M6WEC5_9BACT|nr:MAG: hypothetical protein COU17_02280 [Candidatus Kaiserbacteria bacterium CG10_big_fil_rev_8_21_14_0_10_49_17]